MVTKVRWLFQNHKAHMSRIQVLEYLLGHTDQERLSDDTLIEMAVFHKSDTPSSSGSKGSNTEYAALKLDDRRRAMEMEIQKRASGWSRELQKLNLYANLYDAAQKALTEEERTLVCLYYEDRYTIEEITQLPLTDRTSGLKSRSTLRRMLRIIDEKVSLVVDTDLWVI